MDFLLSPISSTSWPFHTSSGGASSLNRYIQINFPSSGEVAGQLEALSGLYARAYRMLSYADQLAGAEGRANFSQSPTRSTDVDVVDISYFDKTHYLVRTPEYRYIFLVRQIAWNQVNQGVPLYPNDGSVISTGSNTFSLNVGGTGYPLTVIINSGDTNADALEKIAQAIDAANTGVTTAIVLDADSIQLNLYGANGEEQAFFLGDLTGNVVSASGINNSTQAAQDAVFLLNGTIHTQADNAVSLLDGHLQVNLSGTGLATVTTGPETVVDLVQALVETMNDFSSYVRGNGDFTPALAPAWSRLVRQEAGILSQYGLETGSQGGIGLDTLAFTAALRQETSQAAADVSGLASRVRAFVLGLTSYPAGALLASGPATMAGAAYLRSSIAIPWYQTGSGGFWRIV